MVYVMAQHEVADYLKWRKGFDDAVTMRKKAGEKSSRVFRVVDAPHSVVVFMEWDSLANAQKHLQTEKVHQTRHEAGVLKPPEVFFLNEA
jgi:quinol monooxygenase YgiN